MALIMSSITCVSIYWNMSNWYDTVAKEWMQSWFDRDIIANFGWYENNDFWWILITCSDR
jgi:hypothetical protein